MTIEVLGKTLVGRISSYPKENPIQPTLQPPYCHRHAVLRHFPLVPAVSQIESLLEKRLDLPGKKNRAANRTLQKIGAAPEEMSQALLMGRFEEVIVRRPAIVNYCSSIFGPQHILGNLESTAWLDHISGRFRAHKRPQPLKQSPDLPTRLVRIDNRALSDHNQNRTVNIPTALGRSQHDLSRATARELEAKGGHKKARNLAMGKPQVLVQVDRQRLRLWPNLTGSCTQGIGGLQSMTSLDPTLATEAMADFDVEAAADGFARDFDLELRLDLVQLDLPAAIGTGMWKRGLIDFVHPRKRLAVSLRSVVLPRLPAALLRIGFGRSLGEGGCLAFPATANLFEELSEFAVFLLEGFDPLLQPVDQLQELVVGWFSAFCAHQPWLSAGPVTNFSPNPLNNYGKSCCGYRHQRLISRRMAVDRTERNNMRAKKVEKPGTILGPCRFQCNHEECVRLRLEAESICRYCKNPIGYETLFFIHDNMASHHECYVSVTIDLRRKRDEKILLVVDAAIKVARAANENYVDHIDGVFAQCGIKMASASEQPDGADPNRIVRLVDGRMVVLWDESAEGAARYRIVDIDQETDE